MQPNQYLKIIILSVLTISFSVKAIAGSKEINIIKKRYIEYLASSAPDDQMISGYINKIKPDGSWEDIDYKNNNRSGWKPRIHPQRIERMAKAYNNPNSKYSGKPELKYVISKAVKYWLDKDLRCPNWWYNNIAVPGHMANIMVLMGKDLPEGLVKKTMTQIMPRSKIRMTGQNKVWLASNVFVECLTSGDEKKLKKARDVILSEIRVTTKEGIQPDWSFHQHGPQQQFGNYGGAFESSITKWAKLLHDTSFGLDKKQMSIIRNYILEGPGWIMWKGKLDISGCGRQIYKDCQVKKGRGRLNVLKNLEVIDPANAEICQKRLKDNDPDNKNTFVGNKHFWRSDMMVHRRPNWYSSVKMSSKRVIGSETCNSENMLGMHFGDGVLFVYKTAKEYENIQPIWDWHRLPGTTCDQSIRKLVPGRKQCMVPCDFVGGVSDGKNGVAVLDYKRDSLVARKSWFFEDDVIVCLGAGITSKKGGTILTSIQQSLLQSKVTTPAGVAKEGKHSLQAGDWIHHAGIGYLIINGEKPTLQISTQKGDWKEIYPKKPGNPKSGEVFSLWFDHGKTPEKQSYAYVIYPDKKASDMADVKIKNKIEILSNTDELQAVSVDEKKKIMAVFYKPGKLEWAKGKSLETDTPCIVSFVKTPEGKCIYVSEPTHKKKELILKMDGNSVKVILPSGGDAGKSVKVNLAGCRALPSAA